MFNEQLFTGLAGAALVAAVCFDVFNTIILPRLTLRKLRMAPILIGEILWPSYRAITRQLPEESRIALYELFAPLAFLMLLATWLLAMIGGFALLIYSLGAYVRPAITRFSEAAYFAGTSVLTLGFGDMVAAGWPARIVVLLAAVLGLIFMALVVSLLFSMLSYLQQREQIVNTSMSRAGLPPSGVVLLMRYRELGIVSSLSSSFVMWEIWLASILESHRAYPLLMFFRSTSSHNSWLATVGATLDAATLMLTAIENDWIGEADLYYWMGVNSLKAIADSFDIQSVEETGLDKAQFTQALNFLRDAGFKVRDADKVWPYFHARRSGYMMHLTPLAARFESPTHVWLPEFKSYDLKAASKSPDAETSSAGSV